MRVLLAHNKLYYPAYGGGDKSNRLLMEALAARGHECMVVNRLSGDAGQAARWVEQLRGKPVEVLESDSSRLTYKLNGVTVSTVLHPQEIPREFSRRLDTFRPDVVLTSTDDPALLLFEVAVRSRVGRVVYLARTTLDLPFGPECAFPSQEKTELLRQADGIVGVSQYVADYIRRWGQIEAVHVPISLLEPGPYPKLGRFENEFVTMVNPCAVKGITIFLALADELPDVRFLAVPTWGTTQEDLQALRARPNVVVEGPTEDVDALFAKTRVLLVPSLWGEARSRIIPEAMLRGVPVLASNVGGIPEAMLGVDHVLPVRPIERYRAALDDQKVPVAEVPQQDTRPWKEALVRLLADRQHYEELSERARRAALAYAESLSVEPFERYLAEVCARPSRRGGEVRFQPETSRLARLSPEKRRLLALRLKEQAAGGERVNSWFPLARRESKSRLRLFCFPYAGAGTAAFRGWTEVLGEEIELSPARLPGRESRLGEAPIRRMGKLVEALAGALEEYLDRPFAFYGHSMGAVIAFELARLLRTQVGKEPAGLFVSGARGPRSRLNYVPPPDPSEEEFLKDLERLEGIPPEVKSNRELLRVVLPALMADTSLYRNYVYSEGAKLACPIFAYGGLGDPNVKPEDVELWGLETTGSFQARYFEGGHFFIHSHRDSFLKALKADLLAVLPEQ